MRSYASLNFHNGRDREKAYDFTREVYCKFYPKYLARIQNALAKLDDPRTQSMISNMSVGEIESQETDPGADSSQETSEFKKPDLPANKKQKGALALLREQLTHQKKLK